MQAGIAVRAIHRAVGCICGRVPFKGPFAIGHECVAQVLAVGSGVQHSVSVRRSSCRGRSPAVSATHVDEASRPSAPRSTSATLAAYGSRPGERSVVGTAADESAGRVRFADHMLVAVPADVPPLRVAAASDNLADAWRSVVTPLRERPGGSVLIIGGGAKSIGLYAAGLAVAHGAAVVHYVDDDAVRCRTAEAFGAHTLPARARSRRRRTSTLRYDVVVEASSRAAGLRRAIRSLARGGVCTAVGYYLATGNPADPPTCTPPTQRSVSVSRTRAPCSPTCSPSSHAPASPPNR